MVILAIGKVAECAPAVSVVLDPPSFAVDQAATLTITINDADATIADLPLVEGLTFQRRGQNTRHQLVNGSLSSAVSIMFQVQGARPGSYTIPPVLITIDKQQLLTQAISVEVMPSAAAGGRAPPSMSGGESEQMAFLRVSPVKDTSYVGELLPVEIKAYFRRGLRANLNSQPWLSGEGFVLTPANQEPVQTEEMVNNVPYAVLTWPAALSGIKEGRQSVGIGIDATLLLPTGKSQRRRSMGADPFLGNDLFADFFNQQQLQEKKLRIVSREMTLQVLSLPVETRPDDFNGAIGRFELQVQAEPTEVGPGDPITLTMTVLGTGNFDQVEAPILSEPEGWKSYPPSAEFTPAARPGQGSKVFAQAIIARSGDKTAIPPLSFSFFDPESRQYQTLRSDPVALQGRGADPAGKSDSLSGTETSRGGDQQQPESTDSRDSGIDGDGQKPADATELNLAPLQTQLGVLQQGMTPLFTRSSFQIVVLFSLLLLVALTLIKIRARRLAGNPVRGRRQEMTRLLELRLQEMKKLQQRGDVGSFLAACRQAMQEQLGLLWLTEPGAITLADLQQRLAEDSPLTALFATAESSAYIGNTLGSQEMADYAGKVEHALRQLR
ncbi:MAG: BatD family protein [Desulfoarculaceae bacterium]|nr:BatD family protein [Desulfoarculaceae bacterium]